MNLALTGYRRLAVLSLAPTDWRVSSVRMAQFATLPATVTAEKIPRMIRTPKALKPLQNLFERIRGRTHLIDLFALSGHLAPLYEELANRHKQCAANLIEASSDESPLRANAIGHARDE